MATESSGKPDIGKSLWFHCKDIFTLRRTKKRKKLRKLHSSSLCSISRDSKRQGHLVWPVWVVAVLSSQSSLLYMYHRPMLHNVIAERNNKKPTALRKYILIGCMDKEGQGHKAFHSLPPPLFLFILTEWSSSFSHTLTQLPWLILTRYPHWKLFSLTLDTFVLYQSCAYPGSARWHWITSCLIFENNIIDRTEQCTCWLKDFADVLGIRECPSHLHSCALTVCMDHRLFWGLLATRVSTSTFVTTPAGNTWIFCPELSAIQSTGWYVTFTGRVFSLPSAKCHSSGWSLQKDKYTNKLLA